MFKNKITAILLSIFMIISTLAFSEITVKATGTNGWQQNGTTWNYYVSGSKATNWIPIGGKWYYLNSTGAMETGWASVNSKWYYLNPSGAMAIGWINNNNKSYYLNAGGDMAASTTTLDGYAVGTDGAWNGQTKAIAVSGQLKVSYIDVGQADSILIQQGDKSMLIDAGNNGDSDAVKNYITQQGITQLDYVIGTHPHEDHIGGMDYIMNSFKIGKIYMPKAISTTKTFSDVVNAIKNKAMTVTTPIVGDSFKLGEATCTILAPNNSTYKDINNFSIVIKVKFGETSFMFDGDAEDVSEKEMLAEGLDISANVLKVGHHGSSSSSTAEFLEKVNPKYAVISVGKGNDYGHPNKEVMEKLQSKGIKVYRTDECGTIVCTSDGKNISFSTKEGSYAGTGSSSSGSSSSNLVTPIPVTPTMPVINNKDRVVYYVSGGKSYHYNKSCSALSRSKNILEGKLQDVINLGKSDPCDKCVH